MSDDTFPNGIFEVKAQHRSFADGILAAKAAQKEAVYAEFMYIDLVGGDLVTGILLARIAYWMGISKRNGEPRAKICHDDKLWIAKRYEDWWDECRITEKQYRRSIGILESMKLVKTRVSHFNNVKSVFLTLDLDALGKALEEDGCKGAKGTDASVPKGRIDQSERDGCYNTSSTVSDYRQEKTYSADFLASQPPEAFDGSAVGESEDPFDDGKKKTTVLDTIFEQMWKEYPVRPSDDPRKSGTKGSKKNARIKFEKIVGRKVSPEAISKAKYILAAVRLWKATSGDWERGFPQDCITWLNNDKYRQDPEGGKLSRAILDKYLKPSSSSKPVGSSVPTKAKSTPAPARRQVVQHDEPEPDDDDDDSFDDDDFSAPDDSGPTPIFTDPYGWTPPRRQPGESDYDLQIRIIDHREAYMADYYAKEKASKERERGKNAVSEAKEAGQTGSEGKEPTRAASEPEFEPIERDAPDQVHRPTDRQKDDFRVYFERYFTDQSTIEAKLAIQWCHIYGAETVRNSIIKPNDHQPQWYGDLNLAELLVRGRRAGYKIPRGFRVPKVGANGDANP